MVKVISIDDIIEGMILAEKICNSYGQVLLPEGIELKEKHSRVLKTWNVSSVVIKSEEEESEELSDETIQMATAAIQNRISWVPEHPQEIQLIDKATYYLANKMNQEGSK